jgi:hypothetical protein
MNSGQLLNRTLANRLVCQTQQIAIGPTGPVGPVGPVLGALKAFTIFLDYSGTNTISRIYIPPGLFSDNTTLSSGGTFTADVGADLVFVGKSTVTMNNTRYRFVSGITGSGYVAGRTWGPIPGSRIGATAVHYSVSTDYSVILRGLALGNINGANLSVKPSTGLASGFLATITIFYV